MSRYRQELLSSRTASMISSTGLSNGSGRTGAHPGIAALSRDTRARNIWFAPRRSSPRCLHEFERLDETEDLKRIRNYCGLINIARSGFPWEKTTKRSLAAPDFLHTALTDGNHVRLSLRKAACSSMAPPSSTGNPGSVYTNCETALTVRFSIPSRKTVSVNME